MSKSNIEWTQETWNPITGCTKYSEGCKNCYAEKMTKRLCAMGQMKYANGFNNVTFHPRELNRNLAVKPSMIFVNSMSDTFHKDITNRQITDILNVACDYKQHIFQILTKRSHRINDWSYYPKNVWLGVTVEHADYKFRINDLKKTDAKVKFLSCEPLLGNLGELNLNGIDWVICGGESGHKARPMHPDWVENIQIQCKEQGVPFFFKQWGEWQNGSDKNKPSFAIFNNGDFIPFTKKDTEAYQKKIYLSGDDWNSLNPYVIAKTGKKKAGSLLNGKQYKEFPKGGTGE